jgi:hypothetical protein
VTRDKHHGTALLDVSVPGPGVLKLSGGGIVTRRVTVPGPGPLAARARSGGARPAGAETIVGLRVTPKGRAKELLKKKGRVHVHPRVTFTPADGGGRVSESTRLLLKKKHRGHRPHG